jgi:sugar transferase EpsL
VRLKRFVDVTLSAALLILLLPLLCVVSMVVILNMGRPVIFRQNRPGQGGRMIGICKFRTMRNDRGSDGRLLPDSERLTRVGAFLRNASLDELPQLWNVLKGDMSLVGPRPLMSQFVQNLTPEQAKRRLVRPGITGWAQVNGRNSLSYERRFELDAWYVEHQSFWLDMRILVRTAFLIVRREDVHALNNVFGPVETLDIELADFTAEERTPDRREAVTVDNRA